MLKPLITRLNDGREVLATTYKGNVCPVRYPNRTQADRKASELGPGWHVFRGLDRPFYVQRMPAHMEGIPCSICTPAGSPFAAIHLATPPCLECRHQHLETIGNLECLYYRCPNCGATRPVGPKEL